MLNLTRELFALEPAVEKMDFYERALYNDILASQDPESGARGSRRLLLHAVEN